MKEFTVSIERSNDIIHQQKNQKYKGSVKEIK